MRLPTLALPCLLVSLPLSAQVSGGLHVNALGALGGLAQDASAGTRKPFNLFIGGGHLAYTFRDTDEARVTLNLAGWYGDREGDRRNTYNLVQVGVEWRHRVSEGVRGPWLVVGLNRSQVDRDLTLWQSLGPFEVSDTTRFSQHGRTGVKLGAAFQLRRWFSLEGTLNRVALDAPSGGPGALGSVTCIPGIDKIRPKLDGIVKSRLCLLETSQPRQRPAQIAGQHGFARRGGAALGQKRHRFDQAPLRQAYRAQHVQDLRVALKAEKRKRRQCLFGAGHVAGLGRLIGQRQGLLNGGMVDHARL